MFGRSSDAAIGDRFVGNPKLLEFPGEDRLGCPALVERAALDLDRVVAPVGRRRVAVVAG